MKSKLFFVLALCCFAGAQAQLTRFTSVSGELSFSSANLETSSGLEEGNVVRFAPWFNLNVLRNWDGKNTGLFLGLAMHNVGFIYENDFEKWKVRTYNVGIPVGLKFGDMDGTFIYGGYELEFPLHYKEKYFRDGSKERKITAWNSKRVNPYMHAVMVGLNFPKGFNLKFKYYLTEFFNKSFNNSVVNDERDIRYPGNGLEETDADYVAPRDYLTVNVFYISLSWSMFSKPMSMSRNTDTTPSDAVY